MSGESKENIVKIIVTHGELSVGNKKTYNQISNAVGNVDWFDHRENSFTRKDTNKTSTPDPFYGEVCRIYKEGNKCQFFEAHNEAESHPFRNLSKDAKKTLAKMSKPVGQMINNSNEIIGTGFLVKIGDGDEGKCVIVTTKHVADRNPVKINFGGRSSKGEWNEGSGSNKHQCFDLLEDDNNIWKLVCNSNSDSTKSSTTVNSESDSDNPPPDTSINSSTVNGESDNPPDSSPDLNLNCCGLNIVLNSSGSISITGERLDLNFEISSISDSGFEFSYSGLQLCIKCLDSSSVSLSIVGTGLNLNYVLDKPKSISIVSQESKNYLDCDIAFFGLGEQEIKRGYPPERLPKPLILGDHTNEPVYCIIAYPKDLDYNDGVSKKNIFGRSLGIKQASFGQPKNLIKSESESSNNTIIYHNIPVLESSAGAPIIAIDGNKLVVIGMHCFGEFKYSFFKDNVNLDFFGDNKRNMGVASKRIIDLFNGEIASSSQVEVPKYEPIEYDIQRFLQKHSSKQ